MTSALVLGGGGVTGIAWELGVLLGLRDEGIDLTRPDLVLGTSAGSAVGAQLLGGLDLAELYARQTSLEHRELAPEMDLDRLIAFFMEMGDMAAGLDHEALLKVGAFARESPTVPVEVRREVIAWRLPTHTWPLTPLRVTTVDANSGELVVLDASSGVELIDAVAASCAVPGVWPPVPLLGRLLMDGGTRSPANLDLVEAYDEILVLAPIAGSGLTRLNREAEALRSKGSVVHVLPADEEATAAMGPNPLDPTMRPVAAEQGRRQGRSAAALYR